MNISNCPRCDDVFRVPVDDLSHDSQAQCPWCGETFPLSEVIDRLPPVLTILSADGTTINHTSQPSVAAQPGIAPAEDFRRTSQQDLDGFVLADGQPAADETIAFVEDTSIDLTNNSVSTAPKVQATARRKSGGGLRSMLGIVAGGLLAVPIAGGILWGLGLGPFAASEGSSQNRVASQSLEIREDRSPVVDSQAPTEDASAASQTNPEETALMLPQADPPPTEDLEDSNEPTNARAERDIESVDLDMSSESAQLTNQVDLAVEMIEALETVDPNEERRGQWLEKAYRTIAGAGELATGNGPSVRKLIAAIKSSPLLIELEREGASWIDSESRIHDGALIIGVSDGKSLTLGSGKKVELSGAVSVPASGRVMVIGQIVDPQTVNAIVVESLP